MKYAYKTEIKPTAQQAEKIRRCMGICRWLYNRYITENQKLNRMYQRGLLDEKQVHFISGIDFDKYVNNKLKVQAKYAFIGACGSKARKKAIMNAEKAMKNFFAGRAYFPRFKRRNEQNVKLYFPKNNKGDWSIERHRLVVPTFGWIRLKEYGYLPIGVKVISGTLSCKGDRYYVSVLVDLSFTVEKTSDLLAISFKFTGRENNKVILLGKRLAKAKQELNRKFRIDKNSNKNKQKQQLRIQKIGNRIDNIRRDEINKLVAEIVAKKPKAIFFPKLDNQVLHRENYSNSFYHKYACRYLAGFETKLMEKCKMVNIEFHFVKCIDIEKMPTVSIEI